MQDANMSDRRQCWELVSDRTQDNDYSLIHMDNDVLEVVVPYLAGEIANMKHHVEERGAMKPPKDKSEWKLPSTDGMAASDNDTVWQLLNALIARWEWNIVNEEPQPVHTLISFNQAEAGNALGQHLPQSIWRIYASSYQRDTVFRLDPQVYVDIQGGRYVNFQGKCGVDTFFHITLPVGVRYGRDETHRFMRESLNRSTSVVITPTTCKPPGGGPSFNPDPGSGGGNSWIRWAITLVAIGGSSLAVL